MFNLYKLFSLLCSHLCTELYYFMTTEKEALHLFDTPAVTHAWSVTLSIPATSSPITGSIIQLIDMLWYVSIRVSIGEVVFMVMFFVEITVSVVHCYQQQHRWLTQSRCTYILYSLYGWIWDVTARLFSFWCGWASVCSCCFLCTSWFISVLSQQPHQSDTDHSAPTSSPVD